MVDRSVATKLRFMVAGCGSIGKRHMGNLAALGAAEVIGFDLRADRREEVRQAFGIPAVATLEEAWQAAPDAIVITAPTALHLPLALQAAERGVHLFIEKPLANTWDGIDQLLHLARAKNLVSLVGCNMRFHPGLIRVRELLDEGAVGRVIAARLEVGQYLPDWHPWEDYRQSYSARRDLGGGVILDAIHEIDYARWLLGEVTGVFCLAGKLSRLEIDTEDTAALLLRFEQGALGEIHLDYVQRVYSRACRIIGDEGTIHWDYSAGQVRWYSARAGGWRSFDNPVEWQANDMYLDEMRHFLGCLRGRVKPEQDLFEAARVLRVALAAKASAFNPRWIELESESWNKNVTL
jgi:predicted dehydrogenase